MTERQLYIAALKAQILAQRHRARAARQFAFNVDMQVEADVCERTAEALENELKALQA